MEHPEYDEVVEVAWKDTNTKIQLDKLVKRLWICCADVLCWSKVRFNNNQKLIKIAKLHLKEIQNRNG